jgi:replicative DNA helicase
MLLYDKDSELRVIKTLLTEKIPDEVRSTLLGQLNATHFYYEPTQAAFKRIDMLAKKRFEIVSAHALLADTVIDEDLRDILKSDLKEVKACRSKKHVTEAKDILSRYRKVRTLFELSKGCLDALEESQVDVDQVLDDATATLARAAATGAEDEFFLHFGEGDTSDRVLERILNNEKEPRIPTGYKEYDKRNGGFPDQGVVILAATTSGGKSTVSMNIGAYLYEKQRRSVCRVSLEMGDEQETKRLASHLTGIEFAKFVKGNLSPKDKKKITTRFEKFREFGKKHGIRYTSFSPRNEYTAEETFRVLKPYGYDIIVIDYIGLMKGMASGEQWLNLSEVAAAAKRFSRATDCLVILLAQLDDDSDKLRYSRGMKEHADVVWQWNFAKAEQRELRILPIQVSKDRDGSLFGFDLQERYDVMTAFNMPGTDGDDEYAPSDDDEDADGFGSSKKKKKKKKAASDDGKSSKKKKKKKRPVDDDDDDEVVSYAVT